MVARAGEGMDLTWAALPIKFRRSMARQCNPGGNHRAQKSMTQMRLPGGNFGVIIDAQAYKGPLKRYFKVMTRTLLRSRCLMAVSIVVLLASVALLSAATRRPCVHVSSASWHVWKSGYMAKSQGVEAAQVRIATVAKGFLAAPLEIVSPVEPAYSPLEPSILPPIPTIAQIHDFRPPPVRA